VRAFLAGAVLFPVLAITGPIGLPFVATAFVGIVFWDSIQEFLRNRRAAKLKQLVRDAEAARGRRDWSQGRALLAEAEALARRIPAQREFNMGALLQRKAHFAHQEGRPEVAHAAARKALEIARRISDPRLPPTKILFTLAQVELAQDNFGAAIHSCEQALEELPLHPDQQLHVMLLTMLASAHKGMMKPRSARRFLDEAERVVRSAAPSKESLLAYVDMLQGADRVSTEEFAAARSYLDRALAMYERDETADPRIGVSVLSLQASLNHEEGRLDAADSQARRGLQLLEQRSLHDEFLRAELLLTLSTVSMIQGRVDDAEHWAELASATQPKNMTLVHRFLSDRTLARLRISQQRKDEGLALFAAAYRRLTEARHLQTPAFATGMQGDAAILDQAGHTEEAMRLRDWANRIRRDWSSAE
jgi:tetratricopeptide (TPR) repeat protein